MFFETIADFVLRYWFWSAVYVVLFWTTVGRFFEDVVKCTRLYRILQHRLVERWEHTRFHIMGILVMILIVIPVYVSLLFVAPVLWVSLYWLDKKKRERQEKDRKERAEESARLSREREEENHRRAEARKQWFSENRPKLYYNTVSGITAVLRPETYEAIERQTAINRRNGFWEANILCPAPSTIVFVTRQGREVMIKNLEGEGGAQYKIAGWLSQLDEIVESGNVELIRDEKIFVPWVNDTILPFVEQIQILQDCHGGASHYKLVESQAPRQLQPI